MELDLFTFWDEHKEDDNRKVVVNSYVLSHNKNYVQLTVRDYVAS